MEQSEIPTERVVEWSHGACVTVVVEPSVIAALAKAETTERLYLHGRKTWIEETKKCIYNVREVKAESEDAFGWCGELPAGEEPVPLPINREVLCLKPEAKGGSVSPSVFSIFDMGGGVLQTEQVACEVRCYDERENILELYGVEPYEIIFSADTRKKMEEAEGWIGECLEKGEDGDAVLSLAFLGTPGGEERCRRYAASVRGHYKRMREVAEEVAGRIAKINEELC
ncbi:MAG: uncharacterized protein A8A55_0574 [Amphiamblys sp. WSBS2006]|nr:MAG: uncharacterized protein A8A55_0574 [Amphiamblys sp. WSBS2006]